MRFLRKHFDKYHDIIAGIHFEGIVWNHEGLYPKPGFVEKIRELCTKYNIVMCMDEVITGFRVNIGGAQTVLGVTPDLCTMGKAISMVFRYRVWVVRRRSWIVSGEIKCLFRVRILDMDLAWLRFWQPLTS